MVACVILFTEGVFFIVKSTPQNCIANMLEVHCRQIKIRIPLLIIKPITYFVEWGYKVLYHYGMHEPQLLTPARIKYTTLNRTFSCNKAIEELGYKPTVTLMVLNLSLTS